MKHLILVLACALAFSGCSGGEQREDNALVRFKGGVLTKEDVSAHMESLKRKSQFRDKPELLTPEFVFEHALNMEMIIAKGLEQQLHRDPQIRNMLHEQMSDLFLKIMEEKLITPIDRDAITEEEMQKFYEEHKEQYRDKAKYTLRAFSVAPEQAQEAANLLRTGTMDFAAAAAQYASDQEARKNGGATGSRTLRRFQPSWRPVVESLRVGEVTGPQELDGKTWMLLLERKTEPHQYSFEDKKAFIKNDTLYGHYRDQWQKVYDGLKQQFKVEIDQAKLETFYQEAKQPEPKTPKKDETPGDPVGNTTAGRVQP